jgi:hypothetical protein
VLPNQVPKYRFGWGEVHKSVRDNELPPAQFGERLKRELPRPKGTYHAHPSDRRMRRGRVQETDILRLSLLPCSSSLLDYVLFACVYSCHPGVCQTAPIVDTKAFFDAIGRDIGKKLEKHDVSWKQLFTFKSDDWEELGLACKDRK